jgi:hypothetical protein
MNDLPAAIKKYYIKVGIVTVFSPAYNTSHPFLRKAVGYHRKSNVLTNHTGRIKWVSVINDPTKVS